MVDTTKGLALKATDKYLETAVQQIGDEDVKGFVAKLTDEERELVDPAVAAKIAKMAIASVKLESRPPSDGTVELQLPTHVVNYCFSELAAQKLPDGQPTFPEIGTESVQRTMYMLFEHEDMAGFRKFANESQAHMKIALNLLHGAAFRIVAPQLARERDKQEQERLKNERNQRTPSTLPSTSGGQTQSQVGTEKPNVAARIGQAGALPPW